ncbi:MAG TPA: hypothetical protein VE981_06380 [Planctomycetota bacterium]|nr:hypothetical protein [Planctomycetota bacterium]
MDISFISFDERFALALDRAQALQQLIPGTEDYYYYHCLLHEQQGRPEEARKLLETWIQRHGRTGRVEEIVNRHALLLLDKEPKASWERFRIQLGLGFHHAAQVEGRVTRHPSRLDPASISRETLKKTAFSWGSRTDLSGFSDASLDWLSQEKLDPDRRRALLGRLQRPDVPGLVDLVQADLKHKHSSGFGSLEIHNLLLQDQLKDLGRREPALLREEAFVHACIIRLQPGPESMWETDPDERGATLERLWQFVEPLIPAFNPLKAQVLYHQLDLDRSRGTYDRKRFQKYIEIPRNVSYAEPKFLERCRKDQSLQEGIVSLGQDFTGVTLLPTVTQDEPLVVDYLAQFFGDAKDHKGYETWILEPYLRVRFAEAKILQGIGDMEKWYSLLNNPSHYQALKDSVEISFPPQNRTFFESGDAVTIDAHVKNIETLVVKVFEINALNYHLSTGQELDTSIDLDGLVAAEEQTHVYKETPFRRARRTFEFPSLSKAGVFVVEFIGGGISSRALIRKGRLRFVERIGSAGHVFTVLDGASRPLRNASLWLGGREYAADRDGAVTVPFSERPGRQTILLRQGNVTTLESFEHRSETYDFTAGLYVDREALLRRGEAQLLIRPSLQVHDVPVSLKLLETPVLSIRSLDRHGVESSTEMRDLKFHDDRETSVPFQVPEDVTTLTFTLQARVESLSSGKKVDVSDQRTYTLNGIESSEKTVDLHLARTEQGYVLYVLGKTGEARPDLPVSLSISHRHFAFQTSHELQTDAQGRVELGTLDDVTQIQASIAAGVSQTWPMLKDACLRPSTLHARSGEIVRVPYAGDPVERDSVALLERVGETYRSDRFDLLGLKDGGLAIGKLPPGDYELRLKDEDATIELRISAGADAAGWLVSPRRLLQASDPRSTQIFRIKTGKDEIRVTLVGASPDTRVHVFGTRFVPGHSAFHEFSRVRLPEPWAVFTAPSPSAYVSGRDIGDEYRYILERRRSAKLPGNMLTRPGLLLNPWAVRSTQTGVAEAKGGEGYAAAGAPTASMAAPKTAAPREESAQTASFACLDFLANPTTLLANLVPDADGELAIPRKALANASELRIVVVDPSVVLSKDLFLPEAPTPPRDLRLRLGLDPAKHFTEKKEVSVVEGGRAFEIPDLTTSKLETYDTLSRVYSLFRTLSGNSTLDAFEFITRWPKLGDDERKSKYSEFACHELHLFLSRKDPEFFKKVIQPYLRNKKEKTFLDRFLIGDDLAVYVRPWEFGRLNIVERILLSQRIASERGPVSRHASDLCELLRRDLLLENRLFDTALKGKALDTEDALGIAAATVAAEKIMEESSRASFGAGMGGPAAAAPAQMARAISMDLAESESAPDSFRGDDMEDRKSKKEMAPRDKAASAGKNRERDLRRRQTQRPLYRTLDQTQEWAENNYYKLPIEQQGADLVTINRFWRDYAKHDGPSPFLSVHLAEACRNFTEILCAMAVLDLPFEASRPAVTFDGPRMELKPKDRVAVFHRQIKPAEASPQRVPILVSQNFLRDDDRTRFEGEEQFDKYVTDEFLVHTVYTCQVVLTNPTSSTHKLDLLLQIPMGAVPAKNGFQTRGIHVELQPYAAQSLEYSFYFPAAGTFGHYPVHVSKNEQLIANAPPSALKVVERLSKMDETSWEYLSQHADAGVVLKYLERSNIDRLDLDLIAWRMKDKTFYEAVLDLLSKRHVYHGTLWSYSVHHKDATRVRDFLNHREEWLRCCGLRVDGGVAPVDPVERRWIQHLEYAPLVNARAHRLGAARKILNDRFSQQYGQLMESLRYRAKLDDHDLLAVTYYLFLQDRSEEALETFGRVKRDAVDTKIQYDYLRVYAELLGGRPKPARQVAEKYRDHPVDRWRKLFQNALAQLDEIEGEGAELVDKEDRDQRQASLAAATATFDLAVDNRTVSVHFQNLDRVRVNYYRMDLELLFSRQPFVQEQSDRFGFIMPNRSDDVPLPKKGGVHSFALPAEFNGANVVVELVAEGRRVSRPCFAHDLSVHVAEPYGQVRVLHQASKKPLPGAYVKAYARQQDGSIRFFKDGYTDLRGRFDYSSLSTSDLDHVDRFALLVLSEDHGAVVQEAAAPKR